jgi:hypothetical protein
MKQGSTSPTLGLGFRDIPGSAVTNRAGGMSIGMALRL